MLISNETPEQFYNDYLIMAIDAANINLAQLRMRHRSSGYWPDSFSKVSAAVAIAASRSLESTL